LLSSCKSKLNCYPYDPKIAAQAACRQTAGGIAKRLLRVCAGNRKDHFAIPLPPASASYT